ncbi:hypothetical protein ABT369_40535 [Dactylosporangium sp. NPDC000244]|uniref:hypothetical protein n=1 Tax=Dactylosporangium sp. NPDC000244 TaxID=3154365 RepID=UPI00331EE576
MNDWEEGLRVLMRDGGAAPASRVDLGRVVTDGRRRRRAASGAVAAAVLALVAGAAVALPGWPGGEPVPGASGAADASDAGAGVGGFDPVLVLRLRPGWLPDGVAADPNPSLWAARQSERYADQPATTDFTISLYAPGFVPRFLDPATKADEPAMLLEPADSLGGRPAQWYSEQAHPQRSGLLWQWAPDAYASVEGITPGSAAQDRAVWRHVAEQLVTNARRPVPVPGYVTDTPAGMALIGMDRVFDRTRQRWATVLVLNRYAYVPPPEGRPRPGIEVTLTPGGTAGTVHLADHEDEWTIDPVR